MTNLCSAEALYDLSQHIHLQKLSFSLQGPPDPVNLSRIPAVLAPVPSKCLRRFAIAIHIHDSNGRYADCIDRFLKVVKSTKAFTQVDGILQETRFSSIVACGVILVLAVRGTAQQAALKPTVKKRRDRLLRLLRKKMPRSHARGILLYVPIDRFAEAGH